MRLVHQTTDLVLLKDWMDVTVELWQPVDGFPGYDISSKGRVRSWWRSIGMRDGIRGGMEISTSVFTIRKLTLDDDGYYRVQLHRDKKLRYQSVSRLVAKAFIPNARPEVARVVNHISNVSTDNRGDNLEWCTSRENSKHAARLGVMLSGEKHPMVKITVQDVLWIRANVTTFTEAKGCSARFNIDPSHMMSIVKRRCWRHV